jgi:DNA repair protein RadC
VFDIHEGHRQRLKKRFIDEGLTSFEDHQVLELLLFYALPRKDTNELAHTLLTVFGSVKNVS